MKEFYVVWRFTYYENGSITTCKNNNPEKLYPTYEEAATEAERLARAYPNVYFTVCKVGRIKNAILTNVDWFEI